MQVPQIRLQTTKAELGLNIKQPKQDIVQPPAELTIKQHAADLTVKTTPSQLSIDQTRAWEDMDLKSIFKRTEEFAELGIQDWLSGLARVAQQGDEMMRIENRGNPIAHQAKVNSEEPIRDFNIGWIPSHGSVDIQYTPAKVDVNITPNFPEINAVVQQPVHNYTPGTVRTFMKTWPSLKIDFVSND